MTLVPDSEPIDLAGENVEVLPVAFEVQWTDRIHLVQLIRVDDQRSGIGAASQVRRQTDPRNGFPMAFQDPRHCPNTWQRMNVQDPKFG